MRGPSLLQQWRLYRAGEQDDPPMLWQGVGFAFGDDDYSGWRFSWLFEPRELWFGVFWDTSDASDSYGRWRNLDIYIGVIPAFPFWLQISRYTAGADRAST